MSSPVLALTGLVWWRYRWPLLTCVPVWLTYLVLRHRHTPGQPLEPLYALAFLSVIPAMAVVLAVVGYAVAFVGNAPIEAPESAYPARMFSLPLPTRTLVFWPMLQASVVMGVATLAWSVGVWSFGWWPGGLAAVAMAWLQAAVWRPYPATFLRLAAIPLLALAAYPVVLVGSYAPPPVTAAVFAALWAGEYAVALAGVKRAQRGDTPEWAWPGRAARWLSGRLPGRRTDVASALEAQAWFEWRLRGWGLPMVAGIGLLAWLPTFPFWDRAMQNVLSDEVTPTLKAAVGWLSAPGVLLLGTVAWLPLYAGALATDLGGMHFVGRRVSLTAQGVHPFLGLKPLTARGFVLAKWRMALRATLWASAVMLLPAIAAYTVTQKWAAVAAAPAFAGYGPAGMVAVLTALLAVMLAATWLQLVGGLWVGLWGKGWLSTVAALFVTMGWLPLGYAVYWLGSHAEWLAWLPAAACVAVALKLLLAAWLAWAVVCGGHATAGEVVLAAAAWVAFAAGCVALVLALVLPGRASPAAVALAVAVLLPFNRVVAAPLLLALSRHR